MVQSWNWPAVRMALVRIPLEPSLLRPNLVARTLAEIDWTALRKNNPQLTHVVFDKDNTLTAPYVETLHERVEESTRRCIDLFGAERVAILSNSAGTLDDKDLQWKEAIERNTGIRVIVHKQKKPACLAEVLGHFDASCEKDGVLEPLQPNAVLMVGDRLLTDTVFGNASGMTTLHLSETLELKGDNKLAVVLRRMENLLLRAMGVDVAGKET
ncbi:Phosphatidylglycerophosphatase GEP4, mitochondrial [Hondaea fermentalgiana]|uniref:Phosphatidylglycerophosphatase GEP4, mitochondrial n=1 Tax=Hondaea fermentalgiana TaxID=2315210 RepID=A0A2R5GCC9_9STRA|nr:Phosphatidylglycerophosphatase GEP4, mitochondrial [Hondaea fermentalgiana]|eukprot:GBG25394.1 Phosphatidylglycerophosphatase GEP4, mitochondrial [Hondaea fermentalgiana]